MYTIVDLCPLCHANNKNLKSIVSQDSDGILIQEKLRVSLFELVNMEPEISKHICLHCLQNLNKVYNFKQLCLRNIAKFNSYIRTLKNTEEPCKILQVTLIDLKYFKPKNENDSKSEPTNTENLNLDNVIVKSDPNEDGTGIEYVLQGKHRQTTEEIDEKLRNENNVVKTEPANMTDNDDDNKIQTENIIKEIEANIVKDELKYEIVIEEQEDIFYDEIDLKSVLDDLKDKVKNEKINNADEVNHKIVKENPEEIYDEVNIKQELDDDFIEPINDAEYLSTSNIRTRSTEENSCKSIERGDKGQSNKQTIESLHECDCGEGFNQISKLRRHKRKINNDLKPYKCDYCGKAFNRSSDLVGHNRIHTGEKPYKCDICSKAFNQSSNLVSHIRIHTNEKPHKCDICGKAFRVSTHLIQHRLIHTGEKPHKCDICGKAFRELTHLIRHRLIHTGEKKCDICGKAFRESTHLIRHRLIHTGEKPHKCDICGKAFNQSHSLVRHIRIHTNKKPHKCDICGEAFTRKAHLVRHKHIH